jgi:hypothetical protein
MIIGLVSEGVTELPIIQNVIVGFTGNRDLVVDQLSPLRDETHAIKPENLGGWGKVLEFCGSTLFRAAFQQMDVVIVQIDTDVCQDYGVRRVDDAGKELDPGVLIEKVKATLINRMGSEFYADYADRIVCAITVDSIECWLLPLFYTDKRASKVKNCVDTLNQQLRAKGYTIDHKNDRVYEELSAPLKKRTDLQRAAKKQPSLNQFLVEMAKLNKAELEG